VAHRAEVDLAGEARDRGRIERRPPGRRGPDAATRALPRGRLLLPSARHGALPQVPRGGVLGSGVRLLGERGAVQVPLRLLSVPSGQGGNAVSGGPLHHRRLRHARGALCTRGK
jgi:hypothetical protein